VGNHYQCSRYHLAFYVVKTIAKIIHSWRKLVSAKKLFLILFFFTNFLLTIQALEKSPSHTLIHELNINSEPTIMHGMYGNYPMTREASGTSWVPDSSPPAGFHSMYSNWMFMFSGFSYFVIDIQRGKRGDNKLFDENMFMIMGKRTVQKCTFAFRTMFSAEPLTIGKCGYPLLLQTGETCNGITPLIDRQHPHDLFGELAAVFSYSPTNNTSLFLYAGLPGEPALGPPTYFMRFSGEYIPETPLGHHWMDSTHITFGVLTAGLIHKNLKVDGSLFKGREPDQYRFNIEKPSFDSYSLRLSFNPSNNLAFQVSYGFLKSPEQLEPGTNRQRFNFSVIYNKQFENANLQAAAIIGINKNKPGHTLPAFLLEATTKLYKKHVLFSRFELLRNDELFTEPNPKAKKIFTIKKFTMGYIYELASFYHLQWGIGGLISFPIVPNSLHPDYGKTTSGMGFLQIRLV
jgi:hypothetical protein